MITAEPGRRLGAFTLGPRVFIDHADLAVDGPADVRQPRLVPDAAAACPSRVLDALADDLRQAFANEFVGVARLPAEPRTRWART